MGRTADIIAAAKADQQRQINRLGIPTVQSRLTTAIHAVALIEQATAHNDDARYSDITPEVWAAIHDAAARAAAELFCLSELDKSVLETLSPDADQRQDLDDILQEGGVQ